VPCACSVDTAPELCAGLDNGIFVGNTLSSGAGCPFECAPGFLTIHGQCVQCAVPLGLDCAALAPAAFVFTTAQCDFGCRTDLSYVLRNATCVFCNASRCANGSYLAGAACSECRACERRTLVSSAFVSHGKLDMQGSCAEQCEPGFFADFEQCVEHLVVTCQPHEYQMPGTPTVDVMCLSCADCSGRRLVVACTPSRNAQCAPCPALGPNEAFFDLNCSVACLSACLRDATGDCEMCADECLPGTFRDYSGSRTCLQCAPCPPLRANSNYTTECSWNCAEAFTLRADGAECEPETPVIPVLDAPTPERTCNESEFRNASEYRPCVDLGVAIPAQEGLGTRWRWNRWGRTGAGLCEFECLAQYMLFVGLADDKF